MFGPKKDEVKSQQRRLHKEWKRRAHKKFPELPHFNIKLQKNMILKTLYIFPFFTIHNFRALKHMWPTLKFACSPYC